jgi:lysozyme
MPRAMPADVDAAILAAIRQFRIDVPRYAARVADAIKVPLQQHQFDALVSFDLNTGGIYRARLTAAINDGDPDAARHFMGWLKPIEIKPRRTAEMNLFRTGDYAANGDRIAVWRTDGAGRLKGILKTISGDQLLEAFASAEAPSVPAPLPDLAPALRAAREVEAAANLVAVASTNLQTAIAALTEAA